MDRGAAGGVHPSLFRYEGMRFYFHSSGYWNSIARALLALSALGLAFSWWMGSLKGMGTSVFGLIIGLVFYNMSSKALAYAQVDPSGLKVSMGLLFRRHFPWPEIVNAEPATHSISRGVGVRLCGNKTIAVVTSSSNIVQVNFSRAYVWIFFRFSHLKLSLENAKGFLEMVNTRH